MRTSKVLKIILILVLISVFFIFLNSTQANRKIKNFFYVISSPFQKVLWNLGYKTSDFFAGIGEIRDLKRENEELKLKNQELISENARLSELKKENEFLREALGLDLGKEFELVLAEVLGKDISQDFILINKGSKDGISKGMPVITKQKTLVGEINEVYEKFSRVMLISNKESSFDAKMQEKDISGIIQGKGDFRLSLDFIPQEEEIKEGDSVVTTSIGGNFPKGILVGQVTKVLKSDVEPFQQAQIIPAFTIKNLDMIFIITGGTPDISSILLVIKEY